MTRWPQGEAEIEQQLSAGHLQKVSGGHADGTRLLAKAQRTIATAADVADSDPDSAFVLAYDAARYAGTALLAQQGLRPTSAGGHYAVERALRSQFGHGFRRFGTLRRRRNELEYPNVPDEEASHARLSAPSATHRTSSPHRKSCSTGCRCSDGSSSGDLPTLSAPHDEPPAQLLGRCPTHLGLST
jgi:hypothetical protein